MDIMYVCIAKETAELASQIRRLRLSTKAQGMKVTQIRRLRLPTKAQGMKVTCDRVWLNPNLSLNSHYFTVCQIVLTGQHDWLHIWSLRNYVIALIPNL